MVFLRKASYVDFQSFSQLQHLGKPPLSVSVTNHTLSNKKMTKTFLKKVSFYCMYINILHNLYSLKFLYLKVCLWKDAQLLPN